MWRGGVTRSVFFNPHATDIKLFRYFYHVYIMQGCQINELILITRIGPNIRQHFIPSK